MMNFKPKSIYHEKDIFKYDLGKYLYKKYSEISSRKNYKNLAAK